ncbi:MAG: hypothetical protein ABI076_00955, partial [Acidobacteriaceae bacterium]
VAEDPHRPGLLYAGTDNSIFFTLDDGDHWRPLQTNLPHTPVYWITVQPDRSDLVVATHGRGIWILDDITPLRQMGEAVLDSEAHLFEPRSAYRFQEKMPVLSHPDDPIRGHNPPDRAVLNYYLKAAPQGEVKLAVFDATSKLVRSFSSRGTGREKLPTLAGINRFWWDMRYAPVQPTKLKVAPVGSPWVKAGSNDNREVVTWFRDNARRGPTVAPGTYTVKLTVDGQTTSASMVVMKDPNSEGTDQDIHSQVELALAIRDDLDQAVATINAIELLRKQLAALKDGSEYAGVAKQAEALNDKLIAVEGQLVDVKLTGAVEDAFRNPMRIYGRLSGLLDQVGNLSADFAPTDQQQHVFGILSGDVKAQVNAFGKLKSQDLPTFNNQLKGKGLTSLAIPD